MAFLAGIRSHWQVLRAALAEERSAGAPPHKGAKGHELAFMPAVLEVTETPASPLGRALAVAIAAFFVIAVAWAAFGRIDIIATAQGKIIPSERVKVIQPRDPGVVRAIHVSDGQKVRAGDVLIELDPTDTEADRERLGQDLATARAEIARLTALLTDDPERAYAPPPDVPQGVAELHRSLLAGEVGEHRSRRAALDADLAKRRAEIGTIEAETARLERILPKVRERVEGRRRLVEQKYVARLAFAELEEELFDIEGQLQVQRQRMVEARAALAAAQSERDHVDAEFRRDVLARLTEARRQAAAVEQELIKAREHSRRQTLTAPVAGTVQQLAVHTVGGVVTSAQELMVVVPADSRLEVEAMILNKDIGFVHDDQEAELKIESFPFTRYGTIDGTVLHVSPDAVQDEALGLVYPARVAMARTTMLVGDKWVNLTPGMAVTVEIKTGKRRAIEFLLAPLQRYQDESLRER